MMKTMVIVTASGNLTELDPYRLYLAKNMYSWEHLYRLHRSNYVQSETIVLKYDPQSGIRTALALLFFIGALILGCLYCRGRQAINFWWRQRSALKRTAMLSMLPSQQEIDASQLQEQEQFLQQDYVIQMEMQTNLPLTCETNDAVLLDERSPFSQHQHLPKQISKSKQLVLPTVVEKSMTNREVPQLCLPESDSCLFLHTESLSETGCIINFDMDTTQYESSALNVLMLTQS